MKSSNLLLINTLFIIIQCIPVQASPDDACPYYGDALIAGSIGEPSNLIPMLASDSASHEISGLIFRGLVKYDTDLTLVGDLAESWDISNDGQTITFYLKKNIFWEDGVPFTASDVLFGFETITDPSTPTAYAGDFLQAEKAEVLDDHTFRVHYREPFAPALASWGTMVVLPRHLLEGSPVISSQLTRKPVGLGPFVFSSWKAGESLVLKANPNYFEGRPCLDAYIVRIIPDSATQFLELQAGALDFMSLTPMQYSRQTDSKQFTNNYKKYRYPSFGYTYLAFNLLHPWFKDVRIRKAIAHAIDRQEIIDGVLLGLGSISTGPYIPGTWPYNPDVQRYAFNPEASRRLLADAGWFDSDDDGILDRNGTRFEFTILTNMGNAPRLKAATIIQWRLKKIGIKVSIRVLEWATFINEFVDKKRFQAIILGWNIGLDPDQYDIWHSTKTGERELNFISYENPEVDRLLDRGRRTFSQQKRKKYYDRFQEIIAEDVPYVFLYVPSALMIIHNRFSNIRPTPIGISYNLHRWYVPKNKQRHRIIP